jgi:hypothetical protein
MTPIKAYLSNTGKVFEQKSDALADDTRVALKLFAEQLAPRTAIDYATGTFKEALIQNISPRRLMRLYAKIWRIKQAYDQALAEEHTAVQICQQATRETDELPF